jgi:hypothetical protein
MIYVKKMSLKYSVPRAISAKAPGLINYSIDKSLLHLI